MSEVLKMHSNAVQATKEAFDNSSTLDLVTRFYEKGSNYSGFLFTQIPGNDPLAVTATDFLAASTLSVKFEGEALKRILFVDSVKKKIEEHLVQLPDVLLENASEEHFDVMSDFHLEIKKMLSLEGTQRPNRWVSASKLTARKRPNLFPIRDHKVTTVLGMPLPTGHKSVWLVYQSIMQDRGVQQRLVNLRDRLLEADKIDSGFLAQEPDLRLLDVVLWQNRK